MGHEDQTENTGNTQSENGVKFKIDNIVKSDYLVEKRCPD